MTLAIIIILALSLPLLLYSFVMFDRLVKTEYETHRAAWESDGKPYGFFWRAPECTYFPSGWARNRLSFAWLFTTPLWALDSPRCRLWLSRLRICVLAWNVLIVFSFIALMR